MVGNENPVKSAIFNHLWLGNQIHPGPWIIPHLGSMRILTPHNLFISPIISIGGHYSETVKIAPYQEITAISN